MPELEQNQNFERLTDREISRLDIKLKTNLNIVKEEKEKRLRLRKLNDSLHSSSGKMPAKNFKRPYAVNGFSKLLNTQSFHSQTQNSLASSPNLANINKELNIQKNSSQKMQANHLKAFGELNDGQN